MPITVAITGAAGRIGTALRAGLAREDFAYGRSTVFRSPMRHPETTRGSLIFEMQPLPEISGFYRWGTNHISHRPTPPGHLLRPQQGLCRGAGKYVRGTATAWRFINLRIVGFSLEPEPAQLAEPGRHGATRHLRPHCAFHPCHHLLRRVTNTRRFYTDEGWAELGYDPQDDAEQFAHRWPNAAPPALQGMTFTDPDYVGD